MDTRKAFVDAWPVAVSFWRKELDAQQPGKGPYMCFDESWTRSCASCHRDKIVINPNTAPVSFAKEIVAHELGHYAFLPGYKCLVKYERLFGSSPSPESARLESNIFTDIVINDILWRAGFDMKGLICNRYNDDASDTPDNRRFVNSYVGVYQLLWGVALGFSPTEHSHDMARLVRAYHTSKDLNSCLSSMPSIKVIQTPGVFHLSRSYVIEKRHVPVS